jgi:hypothetical protein
MPERAVRIEGLRELERAFKLYGRGLEKGVREALEAAAEPVRSDAQTLALAEIPRINLPSTTVPWHRMRVGVTRRTAYVAPEARGAKNRQFRTKSRIRSNQRFANKLLTEAMEPALDRNIANVEREIGVALDDLGRRWERV